MANLNNQSDARSQFELLSTWSGLIEQVCKMAVHDAFDPDERKVLRLFPTAEAAEMLGISDSRLRALAADKALNLPKGVDITPKKRGYTLEQIEEIRAHLRKVNPKKYTQESFRDKGGAVVVAMANFKGGTGKTTLSVNLSHFLALRGFKTLFIDADPQGSATSQFDFRTIEDQDKLASSIYPILRGSERNASNLIRKTYWGNFIDIIPADLSLYQVEYEVPALISGSIDLEGRSRDVWRWLGQAISHVRNDYDVIIIDTPPYLGWITFNVMFASDIVFVPLQPSIADFHSTGRFMQMLSETLAQLERVDGGGSWGLKGFHLILNRTSDSMYKHHNVIMRMCQNVFKENLLQSRVIQSAVVANAGQQSVYEQVPDKSSKRAHDRALKSFDEVNLDILSRLRSLVDMRSSSVTSVAE